MLSEENIILIQFKKIKIMDYIANSIANYGVQNGYDQLFDKLDLNCGAVPDGDVTQVIDFEAPNQFLSLYSVIAENRFAMAVTELLKMNELFITPILDFCFSVGSQMQIDKVENAEDAYKIYNEYILDGMPDDETKQISDVAETKICWTKTKDTHEEVWNKVGGELTNYYKILQAFVNGLFHNSNYTLQIENMTKFTLEKVF